jgi:hypothetical protein
MIRARCTNPARTDDARVNRSSSARSPSCNPSAAAVDSPCPFPNTPNRLTTSDTAH